MANSSMVLRYGLPDARKLAEWLGHLNVAWAAVEYRMFGIFMLLSGAPGPIARGIYFSIRTTRGRIELIQAIAPIVLRRRRGDGTLAELKRLNKILGGIMNLAGQRNRYIHDPWSELPRKRSQRVIQLRLTGKELHSFYESVRSSDIIRLLRKIESRLAALRRFYRDVEPKIPALHEKLGKRQALTLLYATKSTRPRTRKAKR